MKCQVCHCEISYKGRGRPPLYCGDCAYLVHLDQKRLNEHLRYHHKRKYGLFIGTNNFSQHRQKNFDFELNLVRKQIVKLGFKRQFS